MYSAAFTGPKTSCRDATTAETISALSSDEGRVKTARADRAVMVEVIAKAQRIQTFLTRTAANHHEPAMTQVTIIAKPAMIDGVLIAIFRPREQNRLNSSFARSARRTEKS